jgi:predicted DNA-binding transcriptional regulator YafY
MNTLITDAVRDKRVLALNYEPGARLIEPHAYGRSAEGHDLLRAYQTSGASAKGEPENWKLFRLDRVKSLAPTDGNFSGPRPGYRRGDKAMKGAIYAQL